MASSLQKQLASLRLKENLQQQTFRDTERPSVLFDHKSAATISLAKIRQIALEGYVVLIKQVPEISEFKNWLFEDDSTFNMDREKITPAENQEVKNKLIKLLILLSQHLNSSNALKVIEYLLRNFEVHKFESEELIIFFMHFHATPAFVKLLQNINLENKFKWYAVLNEQVKRGASFDRQFILKNVIKGNFSIIEQLLDFNLRYASIKSVEPAKISTVTNSKALYYVTKTSESQGYSHDSLSYRFFIIVLSELLESFGSNANVHVVAKKVLWSLVMSITENKNSGFLDGCLLLGSLLAKKGQLNPKELRMLLEDLLQHSVKSSTEKTNLFKFLFFCCSGKDFKLTSRLTKFIDEQNVQIITSISKYHSNYDFCIQYISHLISKQGKGKGVTNEELGFLNEFLATLYERDTFFKDSKALKHILLDKLAGLFVAFFVADNASHFQTLLEVLGNIKQVIIFDIAIFLEQLYHNFAEMGRKSDSHISEAEHKKLYSMFRANLKKVFGEVMIYGLFEEVLTDSLGKARFGSVMNLQYLDHHTKLRIIRGLQQQVQQGGLTLKLLEKEQLAQRFMSMFEEERNLECAFAFKQLIKSLGVTLPEINLMNTKIINKIIDLGFINYNVQEDPRFTELIAEPAKNSFEAIFKALAQIFSNDQLTQISQKVNGSIDQFLKIEYSKLLQLLRYFMNWNNGELILQTVIVAVLEHSLQSKHFNSGTDSSAKISSIINYIKLHQMFSQAAPSAEKTHQFYAAVLDSLASQISGNAKDSSEKWPVVLSILSELVGMSVPLHCIAFLSSESHILGLIEYIITQNWNSMQSRDLRVLVSLTSVFDGVKFKSWNRLYELASLLLIKFLFEVNANNSLSEGLNLSLMALKNLVKAYCDHFVETANKKTKKGLFIKKLVTILMESAQMGSLSESSSFIQKLKTFLAKKVDTSAVVNTEAKKFFEMFCTQPLEQYFAIALDPKLKENLLFSLMSILKDLDSEFAEPFISHIQTEYYLKEKMSTLGVPLCQFYLKNHNYEEFLGLLDNEVARNNSINLFKGVKRYLSPAQDFAKVITLFKIWKGSFLFDLGDIKFSVTEFLYLLSAVYADALGSSSNTHAINYSKVISELGFLLSHVNFTPAEIISVFAIIRLNLTVIKKLKSNQQLVPKTPLISLLFKTTELCLSTLQKHRSKFTITAEESTQKSKPQVDDDMEGDSRALGIKTVLQRTGLKSIDDLQFEFFELSGKQPTINSTAFLSQFSSSLFDFIKLVLDQNVIHGNIFGSEIAEGDDQEGSSATSEETIVSLALRCSIELFLFFIKQQTNDCFKSICTLLESIFDQLSGYQRKYIHQKNTTTLPQLVLVNKLIREEFKIHLNIIERVAKLNISNPTDKLFVLLGDLFKADQKANDGSILHLLDQVTDSKKIFYQLQLTHSEKFNQSIALLTSVSKSLDKPDQRSVLLISLVIHCLSTNDVPDYFKVINFLYEFINYAYFTAAFDQAPLSPGGYAEGVLALLGDFFKISLLLLQPESELADISGHEIKSICRFIDLNSKNANNSFSVDGFLVIVNLLSLEILKKKQLSQTFADISRKLTIDENDKSGESSNKTLASHLSTFLSFYSLYAKEIDFKASQTTSKGAFTDGLQQTTQTIKKFMGKILPAEFLAVSLFELLTSFKTKAVLPSILIFSLDLLSKKLEEVTITKTFKSVFTTSFVLLVREIIEGKVLVSKTKLSNKFMQSFLKVSNQLFNKNQPFAITLFETQTEFLAKSLEISERCQNIKTQFEIYLFISRFAVNLDENFLSIYNILNEQMLSKICTLISPSYASGIKTLGIAAQIGSAIDKQASSSELLFSKALQFFTNIIATSGNFFEPFVSKTVYVLFCFVNTHKEIDSKRLRTLLDEIANKIEFRISLPHISGLIDLNQLQFSSSLYEIISSFTSKAIAGLDYDTFVEKHDQIFKTLIKGLENLFNIPTWEIAQKGLGAFWIETFTVFSLKCNENQLKLYFARLKKWVLSEKTPELSLFKKLILTTIFNNIVEKLGNFVLYLYGELFDFLITTTEVVLSENSGHAKKLDKRSTADLFTDIKIQLLREILKALALLESTDKEGFVDSFKFDKLSQLFSIMMEHLRFGMEKRPLLTFFDEHVYTAMVALINLVNDDYKTKTAVSQILRLVRHSDSITRLLAARAVKRIIESQNEAFLTVVNDVLPKLSDILDDADLEVAQTGREIIVLLENLTGENINEYLKNADANFGE